jgi:hypothetical protein
MELLIGQPGLKPGPGIDGTAHEDIDIVVVYCNTRIATWDGPLARHVKRAHRLS